MAFRLLQQKSNPEIDWLWQKPKKSGTVHYTDPIWFEPCRVGKDMLERFMKANLQKCVQLEGVYTNHSIRATVITMLDKAGFEARHIIHLSSHKSENTIKEYSVKCPEDKKDKCLSHCQMLCSQVQENSTEANIYCVY